MDQTQPDEPQNADAESEQTAPMPAGHNAPLGGDKGTENQLDADNAVEEDMLKALDPDSAPS
jgi:hypothetical protein